MYIPPLITKVLRQRLVEEMERENNICDYGRVSSAHAGVQGR